MLVVLGDPPVVLMLAGIVLVGVSVIVVVLVGVSVIVVVVPVSVAVIVTVVVLVGVAVIVVVLVLAPLVLAKDADPLLIPTAARRGGIPPGGRACGASSPRSAGVTRCTRCRTWGAYSGCRSVRGTCGGARRFGDAGSGRTRCRICSGAGSTRGAGSSASAIRRSRGACARGARASSSCRGACGICRT